MKNDYFMKRHSIPTRELSPEFNLKKKKQLSTRKVEKLISYMVLVLDALRITKPK
jgi:hypothetical protein